MATQKSYLDPETRGYSCYVSGCRTMPYVALRTAAGRKALCLNHFEKLNATRAQVVLR